MLHTKTKNNKVYASIEDLQNWDKNPRSINKENFERLKKQLKKLGEYKPLLVTPEGVVLGGNMRLRAYREMGIEEVWVSVIDPKSEELKIEYALSDNDRAGQYVDDDLANLIGNFPEVEWGDYAVDLDEPELVTDILEKHTEVEEDEPPAMSEDPAVSVLGEVYQLGRHRLMCGDSTKIEDVEKLMDGKKADMVFTDPPYLMGFEGNVHADGSKSHNAEHGAILNDKMSVEEGEEFLSKIIDSIRLFTKGAFYVCFYRLGLHHLFKAIDESGMDYKSVIIWNKGNHTLSNSDYMSKYEPIVYGWVDEHVFNGHPEFDIWDVARTQINDLHPTMKPIELCARAIKNSSNSEGLVLDLFGGSGSTLIACEQTNRICYMMELDPKYCDVIRKRYAKFIGKEEEWQTVTPKL